MDFTSTYPKYETEELLSTNAATSSAIILFLFELHAKRKRVITAKKRFFIYL
jgi:hypothetical protein